MTWFHQGFVRFLFYFFPLDLNAERDDETQRETRPTHVKQLVTLMARKINYNVNGLTMFLEMVP